MAPRVFCSRPLDGGGCLLGGWESPLEGRAAPTNGRTGPREHGTAPLGNGAALFEGASAPLDGLTIFREGATASNERSSGPLEENQGPFRGPSDHAPGRSGIRQLPPPPLPHGRAPRSGGFRLFRAVLYTRRVPFCQ